MGFTVSLFICKHSCIVGIVAYIKMIALCAVSTVFGDVCYYTPNCGNLQISSSIVMVLKDLFKLPIAIYD